MDEIAYYYYVVLTCHNDYYNVKRYRDNNSYLVVLKHDSRSVFKSIGLLVILNKTHTHVCT